MMRSLYSGVTGLKTHQTRMDVIGNNIANVNTTGYKSSRTVFQDLYSQTLSGGSRNMFNATTNTGLGGVNPKQVGLGVTLSTIDVQHTPGAAQYTGNTLDLCINDDGFFVIAEASGALTYTRAGNFYTDDLNYLVTGEGKFVTGFMVDPNTGDLVQTNGTTPADGVHNAGVMGQIQLVHPLDNDSSAQVIPGGRKLTNISIGENGLITAYYEGVAASVGPPAITAEPEGIVYLGQIRLATFPNTNGLTKSGANQYTQTSSSGTPYFTTPGYDVAGKLTPGALEMSNVDLANEFVDMIVTQRGFQANSRVITTTDSMLEELINLKR